MHHANSSSPLCSWQYLKFSDGFTSGEIIGANYPVVMFQQAVNHIGSYKTGSPGNKDSGIFNCIHCLIFKVGFGDFNKRVGY